MFRLSINMWVFNCVVWINLMAIIFVFGPALRMFW